MTWQSCSTIVSLRRRRVRDDVAPDEVWRRWATAARLVGAMRALCVVFATTATFAATTLARLLCAVDRCH